MRSLEDLCGVAVLVILKMFVLEISDKTVFCLLLSLLLWLLLHSIYSTGTVVAATETHKTLLLQYTTFLSRPSQHFVIRAAIV